MKILVDEQNKAVVAFNRFKYRTIKGRAIAREGDEFDVEFGTELAISKCKYNTIMCERRKLAKEFKQNYNLIQFLRDENRKLEKKIEELDERAFVCEQQVTETITNKYPSIA